jgi:DNA-binding GntR family transcriptional regulator
MPIAYVKEVKAALPPKAEHGTSIAIAYQQIRDLVIHGKLSPGTWVVEGDLAERLNMSRTPIRSALHLLQREGYIVERRILNKSRMMVAPLTKEDANELYSIIGRVEGLAGRQIALLPKSKRTEIAQTLKEHNHNLGEILKERALGSGVFYNDRSFHKAIVNSVSGPRLTMLHEAIEPQAERYWRLYASSIVNNLHLSIAEHDDIIRKIAEGDPDRIDKAIQANWQNGYKRLETVIDIFGERGSW